MAQLQQSVGADFIKYIASLATVIGHADRDEPLHDYCVGLLMPGERKSVEPMAAVVSSRVSAKHQSLLHFVGQAAWSDEAVLGKILQEVQPSIEACGGPITAWIVDDTGVLKKGRHSVGVARQYCGRVGKTDNCQVAVSLSIANHAASLPVAYQLYLPREWTDDPERRAKAHVPQDITFQTKAQISLGQIKAALDAGVRKGVVLADAAYGVNTEFRTELTRLGLIYALAIQSNVSVWPPGTGPLPAKEWSGRGRRPTRLQRNDQHKPCSVKELALSLPNTAWQSVAWREGSADVLSSRFAAIRIRPANEDFRSAKPHPVEWLLIEWPENETEPTKYWVSALPENTALETLVDTVKRRWRIERDYQELKSELGLAHFEGRGWRGFHHHATMCIAAYGFLIRQRAAFPPSATMFFKEPALSNRSRPRGSPDPVATPRQ